MENKNILIITYYWPPSGGSGVQRWVYFSKYLKKFGWNPMVLTVSPKKASYRHFDESLLDIVKEINICKDIGIKKPEKLLEMSASYSFLN